jgi:hypothetical protein
MGALAARRGRGTGTGRLSIVGAIAGSPPQGGTIARRLVGRATLLP